MGSDEPMPVFVCGRQHAGNTLVTTILGRLDGCFAITWEGTFFEHQPRLKRLNSPIERIDWIAQHLGRDNAARQADLERHLRAYLDGGGDAAPLALYREAMRHLSLSTENRFWVQKATSYVFYARHILSEMPDARLIYMMRNPYDFAASRKRRSSRRAQNNPRFNRFLEQGLHGTAMSWNRGVQILQACLRDFPDRVILLKYEELVSEPEQVLTELCEKLGVEFDPAMMDVEHINPSENEYKSVEGSRGLDLTRLYYYTEVLNKREQVALDLMLNRREVDRYYPELPHRDDGSGIGRTLLALPIVIGSAVKTGCSRVLRARRLGIPFRDYLIPRLRRQ